MNILAALSTMLGCYIVLFVETRCQELSVDPLSIFADQYLYKFCWNQNGPLLDDKITVVDTTTNSNVTFNATKDEQFSNRTYCIEHKDGTKTFMIPLPMTIGTQSPIIMKIMFKFYQPLAPQIDLIKFQTVPAGIHVELNNNFAGKSMITDASCQVLLITEHKGNKTYDLFEISSRSYHSIQQNSTFVLYYTCIMPSLFVASTRFGVLRGFLGFEAKTDDLQPLIHIPFRRFIMATWKHPLNMSRRYDVAIYKQLPNDVEVCVNLFRILANIFPKDKTAPKQLASNCERNVPIEDLGCFNDDGNDFISVTLDTIIPLQLYKKYKFVIFWEDSSKHIMTNYLPLNLLPNENSGEINRELLPPRPPFGYSDLINKIHNMGVTMLSVNNHNPFIGPSLTMTGYERRVVLPSVTTNQVSLNLLTNNEYNVSKLYENYKLLKSSKTFSPYFYVLYISRNSPGHKIAEIVQLEVPENRNFGVTDLLFEPNNVDFSFTVSWKIAKYPISITPATFFAIIRNDSSEECHSAYFLGCRTCNRIYMEKTLKNSEKWKMNFKSNCRFTKELNGYYDAVDSSIILKTEQMPPLINFKVEIRSFTFDVHYNSLSSKVNYITESGWQKYGAIVVGVLSALLAISFLSVLYMCCKRQKSEPEIKEKEDSNMYEQEDQA